MNPLAWAPVTMPVVAFGPRDRNCSSWRARSAGKIIQGSMAVWVFELITYFLKLTVYSTLFDSYTKGPLVFFDHPMVTALTMNSIIFTTFLRLSFLHLNCQNCCCKKYTSRCVSKTTQNSIAVYIFGDISALQVRWFHAIAATNSSCSNHTNCSNRPSNYWLLTKFLSMQ